MEVSFSCLPITALCASRAGDRDLLLSGRGSSLYVYDCVNRQVLVQRRIFKSQVIHGISTRPAPINDEGEANVLVLLWAGNAAAILRIKVINRGAPESIQDSLLTLTELLVVTLPDWALFGGLFEPDHYNVVQAYVVTAHNEVHEIALIENRGRNSKTMSCSRLVSGPRCVLYSANACSTSSGLLVAAGTIFGEVVVWSADKTDSSEIWVSRIISVLLGHKGSVFGVCISEDFTLAGKHQRLLATCSDDRTIRLWTVQEHARLPEEANTDPSKLIQLSDMTGYGESDTNAQSFLAMAWGHSSRIWTVRFLPAELSRDEGTINLISNGEDALFHLWEATLDSPGDKNPSNSFQLLEIGSYANHAGKNIWSSGIHLLGNKNVYYTGGADGSIVATTLNAAADTMVNIRDFRVHMSFENIFNQIEANCPNNTIEIGKSTISLKQYVITEDRSILATTASGKLLHGRLEDEHEEVLWRIINTVQSKSPMMLCCDRDTGLVFFGRAGGNLGAIEKGSHKIISSSIGIDQQTTFMCFASRPGAQVYSNQVASLVIPLSHKCCAALLTVAVAECLMLEDRVHFSLPPGFVPMSACHDVRRGLLFLGSRSGSVAIVEIPNEAGSTAAVFADIHTKDSVTSIMPLRNEVEPSEQDIGQDLFILTTGRDGNYAVHKLSQQLNSTQVPMLQTVHRSSPPLGPNIEGAYLTQSTRSQRKDLLLYGFKSKDFVVWNETQQTEVLSVDCGGAHRSWAYQPSTNATCRGTIHGGTFVWTKAGAFNIHKTSTEGHYSIQTGSHGREVKALTVLPFRLGGDTFGHGSAALIATGAEDTTIRLFVVKASNSADFKEGVNKTITCIRTLNKHTTGIHCLEFSACGRYLFSSGGCEELFVWRLHNDIPVVGVGVVLECMLPKTGIDADARITNFTIRRNEASTSKHGDLNDIRFKIAATYSNGKVKLLEYFSEQGNRRGNFQLLEEIIEGTSCLTQLQCDAKGELLLTAGTNGFINVYYPRQCNFLWKHQIHQNSIQASLLVKIPGFSSTWLVITGGDDNAIGVTVFYPNMVTSKKLISAFRTLLIPNAHAAAVTAVVCLSQFKTHTGSSALTFASVSNDQKIKIWRVTLAVDIVQSSPEMRDVEVEKIAECWTSVADASALEYLSPLANQENQDDFISKIDRSDFELLVVGVGMEIVRLSSY